MGGITSQRASHPAIARTRFISVMWSPRQTTQAPKSSSLSGQCLDVSLIHSSFSWADDTHGLSRRVGFFPLCISTSRLCSSCLDLLFYIEEKNTCSLLDIQTHRLSSFHTFLIIHTTCTVLSGSRKPHFRAKPLRPSSPKQHKPSATAQNLYPSS